MYTAREGWYPGPSIGLEARSETSPTTSDSRTVVTGGGVTIPPPPPVVTTLTSLTRNGDELGGTAQVSWNCIRPSAEYFTQ